MLILWKDSFSIDGSMIDADHMFLIDLMNEILRLISEKAAVDSVAHKLISLKIFAEKHFEREEIVQLSVDYPDYDNHALLHKQLMTDLVDNIKNISESSRSLSGNTDQHLKNARRFMNRWLVSHIIHEDTKMRPYVEAMRAKAESMGPLATSMEPRAAPPGH